jgi:hypothetical protein
MSQDQGLLVGSTRKFWLMLGLFIGLGLGAMIPPVSLHAVATHGEEGFSVCTGELEPGFEGIYFLDYQTGELSAAFLHPRTGKFLNFYKVNILKDFAEAKTPKFLLTSGTANLLLPATLVSNANAARGIIYVTEMNSGICCAYVAPYGTNRVNNPNKTEVPLVKLDTVKFRSQVVRDNK